MAAVHSSGAVSVPPQGQVQQQPTGGVGDLGHGVDLHPDLQPARQLCGRDEHVAGEGEREDQHKGQALDAGWALGEHGDQGRDPADREGEQHDQPAPGERGQRAAVGAEAEDRAEAEHQRQREHVLRHIAEHVSAQRRGTGDRQAAEAVEDTRVDVGVERDRGVQGDEQQRLDRDPGQHELEVGVPVAGDRLAEQEHEHQHERDRHQQHVQELVG